MSETETIIDNALEMDNAIEEAETTENGQNENDYQETLMEELKNVSPKGDKTTRINELKRFIKNNLMLLRQDEAEAFITLNFGAFAIGNDGITILKKFYKAEKKNGSKNKAANDLKIHPMYKGMYTLSYNKNEDLITVIPHTDKIADVVTNNRKVVTYKDQIYAYENKYYQVVTELLEFEVVKIISDICKGVSSNKIVQYTNSAMKYIRNKRVETEYPFNTEKNMINVQNGIVVIDPLTCTAGLIPHNPERRLFNYVMPVKYDPHASPDIMYNEFSKYVEDPEVLIQIAAQSILQTLGYGPYKLFYILQGMRDTGKTSYLEWLERMIGEKSVCSVGLNELSVGVDKFSMASLEGKIINLHDDMGYFKMDDVGTIKRLVGKYFHEIQKKGIQRYTANLSAVHVFSTNHPPAFDRRIKNEEAFWDKVIFVEFKNHMAKDYTYKQRTMTEENVSGLFNLVLRMVCESIALNDIPIKGDAIKARELWMKAGNPLYMFLLENMTEGGETYIQKQELLEVLKEWCEDTKKDDRIIPKSVDDLVDHVKVCGGEIETRRNFNGVEKPCYMLPWSWKYGSKYRYNVHMTDRAQAMLEA